MEIVELFECVTQPNSRLFLYDVNDYVVGVFSEAGEGSLDRRWLI